MIRSEKDFLEGLIGAIYWCKVADAPKDVVLEQIAQIAKNRLLIYSGQAEPGYDVTVEYHEPPKDFRPVPVEGKSLSETIIEDRG